MPELQCFNWRLVYSFLCFEKSLYSFIRLRRASAACKCAGIAKGKGYFFQQQTQRCFYLPAYSWKTGSLQVCN